MPQYILCPWLFDNWISYIRLPEFSIPSFPLICPFQAVTLRVGVFYFRVALSASLHRVIRACIAIILRVL